MTRPSTRVHDGLWADALTKRAADEVPPPCIGCGSPTEPSPPHELTLLWRRGKRFRRHRVL